LDANAGNSFTDIGSHFLGMFMRNVLSVWYEIRNVIPQSQDNLSMHLQNCILYTLIVP